MLEQFQKQRDEFLKQREDLLKEAGELNKRINVINTNIIRLEGALSYINGEIEKLTKKEGEKK
jgi:predicted nuclease with TOPRIM domain